MLTVFSSELLSLFFAIFLPTAQFCSLNQKFYSQKQLCFSLFLAFFLALALASVFSYFMSLIEDLPLTLFFESYNFSFIPAFTAFCSFSFFFILNERFFDETFQNKARERKIKITLLLVFTLFSAFFSLLFLNALFILLFISSAFDAIKNAKMPKQIIFDEKTKNTYYTQESKTNIKLKHKPNIYLLLLESYQSANALKKCYGLDDSPTNELFANNNFTDYKNVYSNSHSTNRSLSDLLRCKLFFTAAANTKEAFVLDVLRENGYGCEFFDTQFYVFGEYMKKNEYSTFFIPQSVRLLYLYLGPLWGQSKYLRKFVKDIDPFEVDINFNKLFQSFKERIHIKKTKPTFYALRFGANHINVRNKWSNDQSQFITTTYPIYFKEGQEQIKQVVTTIIEKDPQALILAIGDHGALRHYNINEVANNLKESLTKCEVTNKEFALDLFSVRCAIRWTHPHKSHNKVLSHVNIFPYIFESLGAGDSLLDNLQPNISIYALNNSLVVSEGKVLKEIKPYKDTEYYKNLKQAFLEQKACYEECLLLAYGCKGGEQIEILEQTYKKFPDAQELQLQYITALYDYNRASDAIEIAQNILSYSKHKELQIKYFSMLSEIYPAKLINILNKEKISSLTLGCKNEVIKAYIRCGHIENAHELIKQVIELHCNNRSSFACISRSLIALKDHRTLFAIASSIKKRSTFYDFHIYLLIATFISKDWIKAEQYAMQAVKDWPKEIWAWLLYSSTLEKNNKAKDAILVLLQACRLCSQARPIHVAIGHLVNKHKLSDPIYTPYKLAAHEEMEAVVSLFMRYNYINKDWYTSQLDNTKPPAMSHWHYISEGIYEGLNPTPWFDSIWYIANYPEVWRNGINPFVHFLTEGIRKLYSPSLFHNPRELFIDNPELIHDNKLLFQEMDKKWGK